MIHNKLFPFIVAGLSTSISLYLYISAVILIIFAVLYLILEVTQGLRRKTKYLKEYENYLQVVMFLLVIVFVFPVGHECWCYPSWRWQIGALTVFLAWLNSLTLLKDVPLFGQPVTMLFNVYLNFIKLIYLPILLILTFSFPFYMLFVRDIAAYEVITSTTDYHHSTRNLHTGGGRVPRECLK